jgi:ribose-phosphate pyrophosphokinase
MHSYVPEGIINNLYERYSQTESFEITMAKNNIDPRSYDYFIAPDNGAIKKSQKITKEWNVPLMVAAKKRDEASGYTVFDYLVTNGLETKDKTCIILDDICDGGATFINLAENLKAKYGFKKVDLFITHGLFSKGKNLPNVDNIFSFSDYEQLIKG